MINVTLATIYHGRYLSEADIGAITANYGEPRYGAPVWYGVWWSYYVRGEIISQLKALSVFSTLS
jgi:hypothetical protein